MSRTWRDGSAKCSITWDELTQPSDPARSPSRAPSMHAASSEGQTGPAWHLAARAVWVVVDPDHGAPGGGECRGAEPDPAADVDAQAVGQALGHEPVAGFV